MELCCYRYIPSPPPHWQLMWLLRTATVLDGFATSLPGRSLYYPSRSQKLPKLRAFIVFAAPRMRQSFMGVDYNTKAPGTSKASGFVASRLDEHLKRPHRCWTNLEEPRK